MVDAQDGAGRTRTDVRDGRRSIAGYGRCRSTRTREPGLGPTGGSSTNCRALVSPCRRTSVRAILLSPRPSDGAQRGEHSWRDFLRLHAATTLACDFFTVETAWLKRIYVLFFMSLESRRIEFVACALKPTGAWVAQQARNVLMTHR
jgi:hypothetical protein